MKITVAVMAGGVGSRFWPASREKRPKQLLEVVTKGRTLIQLTLDRIKEFADYADTLVITNDVQRAEVEAQLPDVPKVNIISEPFGRNTAACISLAEHILRD